MEARAAIHRNAYPGSEPPAEHPFAVARSLCSAPRGAKGKRARGAARSRRELGDRGEDGEHATLPKASTVRRCLLDGGRLRMVLERSPRPPRDVDRLRAHAAERVAAWIAYDSSPVGTGLAAHASTKPLGEPEMRASYRTSCQPLRLRDRVAVCCGALLKLYTQALA